MVGTPTPILLRETNFRDASSTGRPNRWCKGLIDTHIFGVTRLSRQPSRCIGWRHQNQSLSYSQRRWCMRATHRIRSSAGHHSSPIIFSLDAASLFRQQTRLGLGDLCVSIDCEADPVASATLLLILQHAELPAKQSTLCSSFDLSCLAWSITVGSRCCGGGDCCFCGGCCGRCPSSVLSQVQYTSCQAL
jgi:hypothetical protein